MSGRHSPCISHQRARPVSREQRPEARIELKTGLASREGSKNRATCLGTETGAGAPDAGKWTQSHAGAGLGLQEATGPPRLRGQVSGPGQPGPGARLWRRNDQPRGAEHAFRRCLGEEARGLSPL